jgi:hypothetical protein
MTSSTQGRYEGEGYIYAWSSVRSRRETVLHVRRWSQQGQLYMSILIGGVVRQFQFAERQRLFHQLRSRRIAVRMGVEPTRHYANQY